ncbi:hypothetical protein QR98_0042460 [Sarcoptes scabiei]|uniref:Uncharacterized protein n=1 Tax=Sarcoptes scabiei TaxID=52283 RepID=A0A132A460_SARSC|nr:hypothetical protein QR98_0042460 [Sarcoptes scabiei]
MKKNLFEFFDKLTSIIVDVCIIRNEWDGKWQFTCKVNRYDYIMMIMPKKIHSSQILHLNFDEKFSLETKLDARDVMNQGT